MPRNSREPRENRFYHSESWQDVSRYKSYLLSAKSWTRNRREKERDENLMGKDSRIKSFWVKASRGRSRSKIYSNDVEIRKTRRQINNWKLTFFTTKKRCWIFLLNDILCSLGQFQVFSNQTQHDKKNMIIRNAREMESRAKLSRPWTGEKSQKFRCVNQLNSLRCENPHWIDSERH